MIGKSHLLFLALALLTLSACAPASEPLSSAPILMDGVEESLFQKQSISAFGLNGSKKISITIDDGPTAATPAVLEVLRRERVPATFFILGSRVGEGTSGILRQMRADGHLIANHTVSHKSLAAAARNPGFLVREVQATHERLKPYMAPGQKLYFRAPFGAWGAGNAAILNANSVLRDYIGPVFWNIGGSLSYQGGQIYGAADWACWSRGVSVSTCAQGYVRESERHQGGVLLVHDVDSRSAALLGQVIPALKARGYSFIRLDQVTSLDKYQ